MGKYFGTDGIRGRANEGVLAPEMVLRVGRALARTLPEDTVLVGRDTRASGPMMEQALAAGILAEGKKVGFLGVLPTPAVARAVQDTEGACGVMLTASHNPFYDNGIKIFAADGFKISDAEEAALEAFLDNPAEPSGAETATGETFVKSDGAERYVASLAKARANLDLSGVSLVVDAGNGAAFEVATTIFSQFGAKVTLLNASPDGKNINEGCGALHPERAAAKVKELGADLGICLDGDADRVIFIDDTGEVVSGDRVLYLAACALKSKGELTHDTLVATVMSNLGLGKALREKGIALETTGVGDRLVLERMRAGGFNLGGENSGHVIFSDLATTGDGLGCALAILAMMQEAGASLRELGAGLTEFPQVLEAVAVAKKPPLEEVPELRAAMAEVEERLGDDGRILVRYSGTEPKLRILVEAADRAMAEKEAGFLVTQALKHLT